MSRGQRTGRFRLLAGNIGVPAGDRRLAGRPVVALVVVGLVVISAAASACGGDDDEAEARPRRTTTTERETTITTLDPRAAEEQAVIAANEAAAQARIESASPPSPDPSNPVIAATHTGPMLEHWIDTVTILQFNGFALRYPESSQYSVEVESVTFQEVEGQRVAYLEICAIDDAERFSVVTGEVLSSGVKTVQSTEAMVDESGVWKLAERRENNSWEGVAGCAAD